MSPIDELAEFLAAAGTDVPAGPRRHATGLLLDSLGVMVLGSRQPAFGSTVAGLTATGVLGSGDATVFTDSPWSTTPYGATLLNATAMHLSEMGEGVSRAVVHVSNAVAPAALAVLSHRPDVGGERLVRAMALAMEATIRFGLLLNRPASASEQGDAAVAYKAGWWTPSMLGGIGAATVSGLLTGLTPAQLVHAWGITLNCAPATSVEFVLGGAGGKGASMGVGCASGLLAAGLAGAGVTGEADIAHWAGLLSPDPNPARLTAGLGHSWELDFPLYKYFATVGPLHAAMEASLAIARRYRFSPADVERVEVLGYARTAQFLGTARPRNAEAAKTSLRHTVAVALATGDDSAFIERAFAAELRGDEVVGALADRVSARVDPAIDAEYPMRSARARVIVHLRSGEQLVEEVNRDALPRYHGPSHEDLTAKFCAIVGSAGHSATAARAVAERIWRLAGEDQVVPIFADVIALLKGDRRAV